MYSRQEASRLREEFWTAFGKYMQPVFSSEGEKPNWVNYKTGAKHIYFRMQAGKGASIAIELRHPDPGQQRQAWEKLLRLKSIFQQELQEDWNWEAMVRDEHGKTLSRVFIHLDGVHLFNKADWPALISFFKPRIIALDAFWNQVKHEFDVW